MGYVIPFAMFGFAVGAIFFWGLRDKRRRKAAQGTDAAHPKKAA
ncbi:MAG: hypothetical protein WBQ72_18835 [Terriglobales bacterium]|jgi:hypothetical protein